MIVRCANCGQIHYAKPYVDIQQNIIIWDNKAVRLTPREAEILFYILSKKDALMSLRDIYYAVIDSGSNTELSIIRHYLWRVKPRLAKVGIQVVQRHALWGLEWRRLSDLICAPQTAPIE